MLTGTYSPLPGNRRKMLLLGAMTLALGLSLPLASFVISPNARQMVALAPRGLGELPLSFEPNAGQTDPSARFVAHAVGGTLFFTQSGVKMVLQTGAGAQQTKQTGPLHSAPKKTAQSEATGLEFVNANPSAQIAAGNSLPGKVNYIKGKDRANWHTDLPTYGGINLFWPVCWCRPQL